MNCKTAPSNFRSVTSLLLLSLLMVLGACSQKKEKVEATFSLHMAALVSNAYADGGALVMGVESNKGLKFAFDVRDSATIELESGDWNFYAVGWTGASHMEGTPRCEAVAAKIGNEAIEVSLSLNEAKCLDAKFGAVAPLTLVSCDSTSFASVVNSASNCDAAAGSAKSYRLEIKNYLPTQLAAGNSAEISTSSITSCFDTSATSLHPTPWSLPQISADGAFQFSVTAYNDIGCSGLSKEFDINQSISSLDGLDLKSFAQSASSFIILDDFIELPAPIISAISPIGGSAGGGVGITITGENFSFDPTDPIVTIGGVSCSVTTVTDTQIQCTMAASSTGVFDVVVTNPDTQFGTGIGLYEAGAIPTVSGVSPGFGPSTGGGVITISGTNFSNHGGTPLVDIGGFACTGVTYVDASTLTCNAPVGSGTNTVVSVTNANTLSASLASAYTFQDAPTVSSISPNFGASSGSTAITLTGTNFSTLGGNPTVTINGATCSITGVSATTISCTTGTSSAGLYDVIVTNVDGQDSVGQTVAFTYQNAPTISSVSPMGGVLSGGYTLTINGTDFSLLGGGLTFRLTAVPVIQLFIFPLIS